MPWAPPALVSCREHDDEPERAGDDERSRHGAADAGVADDFIPAGQLLWRGLGLEQFGLAGRRVEAIEFGVGAIVFKAGALDDAEGLAQFGADIGAVPLFVVNALWLVGIIAEGVNGRGAKFDDALRFGLLALEREKTAGKFVGDLGAAAGVFILGATKILEFVLLALEFLLLMTQREQVLASLFEFGIDFLAVLRKFDDGKRRPLF